LVNIKLLAVCKTQTHDLKWFSDQRLAPISCYSQAFQLKIWREWFSYGVNMYEITGVTAS